MENIKEIACPHCKETIKKGASKCKHCGSELETIEDYSGSANYISAIIGFIFVSAVFFGFIVRNNVMLF